MIAAAVVIFQLIVPNALVILLVSLLSDSHSGVTWSVVGRALSNSNWPLFLRSDQTASQNVSRWVNLVIWVKPLTLFLIAVAAIVTPIGLYETIEASKDLEHVAFSYIPDKGPLGLGTPLRNDLGFSRTCAPDFAAQVCPGSTGSVENTADERGLHSTSEGIDYRIPRKLAELYQSGLTFQSPTVSSFFDIQARLFKVMIDKAQGNLTYLIDVYRPLGTFLLDDKMQAVEGLVVDTQHPKIGFRNHTAPTNVQYGAEWDEDLLFLEPETKCADVNISLQVEIDPSGVSNFLHTSYLIDKGGFANMNITNPWRARMGEYVWYDGTQENPALDWRAQATGWTMNVFLAYFLNVTKPEERAAYMDSEVGKLFPVNNSFTITSLNQIALTRRYAILASGVIPFGENHLNGTFSLKNYTQFWPNPFSISTENFTYVAERCDGFGYDLDGKANITNIQVKCGLVIGTAHPTRGEKTLIPQAGTIWEHPIYSCASATKAAIKTVRFRYNSTNNNAESIKGLEVLGIGDKVYSSRDGMPLWGIEDANMSILQVNPLWGLIDPSLKNSVNLSTVRAERLYLPAGQSLISMFESTFAADGVDFTPAITGPAKAWRRVYEGFGDFSAGLVDYSGKGGLALYNKWDNLSRTAEGAAQILNLLFTDYAANDLVGTRSQLTTSNLPPNLQKRSMSVRKRDDMTQPREVPVHLYRRVVRYRWVYGIPAFLSSLVVALILVGAISALLTGRGSIQRVKHYLWNLSAGRILTTFIYPGSSHMPYSDTKDWIRGVGSANITISHGGRRFQGGFFPAMRAEGGAVTASYQRVSQQEPREVVKNDDDDENDENVIEVRSVSASLNSSMMGSDGITAATTSTDAVIRR